VKNGNYEAVVMIILCLLFPLSGNKFVQIFSPAPPFCVGPSSEPRQDNFCVVFLGPTFCPECLLETNDGWIWGSDGGECDVAPCSLVQVHQIFGATYCFHLQGRSKQFCAWLLFGPDNLGSTFFRNAGELVYQTIRRLIPEFSAL
jgi:hypothetical protein